MTNLQSFIFIPIEELKNAHSTCALVLNIVNATTNVCVFFLFLFKKTNKLELRVSVEASQFWKFKNGMPGII